MERYVIFSKPVIPAWHGLLMRGISVEEDELIRHIDKVSKKAEKIPEKNSKSFSRRIIQNARFGVIISMSIRDDNTSVDRRYCT